MLIILLSIQAKLIRSHSFKTITNEIITLNLVNCIETMDIFSIKFCSNIKTTYYIGCLIKIKLAFSM